MSPILSPVPNPDIVPGQLLTPTWQAWFRQLYTFVSASSSGGGGIVPASRLISTTAPLVGGGDLSADRTHSISANGITNTLLAQMSGNTIKGNNTGITANAADLTPLQAKTVLSLNNVENTALSTWPGTTNVTTLGTITTGVWNATVIGAPFGGTGQTAYVIGDTLYASATNALSRLAGNVTTAKQFLTQTGSGAASAAPVWSAISASDLPGSFSGFANPSASVGLSAVNGVATTAMRSDAAPQLSQAISPTMTGNWSFTPAAGNAVSITNVAGSLALSVIGNSAGTAVIRLDTQATTGAQTATFTATNKPGSGTTAPDVWVPINLDGTVHYIPAWQ